MTPLAAVDLVLASTSPYRHELLARIAPSFRSVAPQTDETRQPDELPYELVVRLAQDKARAMAHTCPGALIIGSDQVAVLGTTILGKPGSTDNARAQLAACSGHAVIFYTGVCLLDTRDGKPLVHTAIDITHVQFRQLDAAEIERYIERERPLDCAGSFKCEALGIALLEQIQSNDPTALVGLPLIALCRLLREAGVALV